MNALLDISVEEPQADTARLIYPKAIETDISPATQECDLGLDSIIDADSTKPLETDISPAIQESDSDLNSIVDADTTKPMPLHTDKIERDIRCLFRDAQDEVFEDGVESEFIEALSKHVRWYGVPAVGIIHDIVLRGAEDGEAAGEALQLLGNIDQEESEAYRRWLLEKGLIEGASAYVRDGAIVGLCLMGDMRSLGALNEALAVEKSSLLVEAIRDVIEELETVDS